MKEWKVKITYRDLMCMDIRTQIYYSSKNTCQEALNDCLNKFNREHINVSSNDIIGIKATEEFI